MNDPLAPFTPATRSWFAGAFAAPTEVQARGWARIAAGEHALLLAPTGSGKTLAAFLWAIDQVLRLPPDAPAGVRVLYVSPLKALVYDIERNLRAPLVGILQAAARLGQSCRQARVDLRTGDTPPPARRRQLKHPADILITTPESLYLLLGSQAASTLASVHTVIVDEIHALAPSKRGAHLALSLERLAQLPEREPQRIGLSATVRPHDEAARFLGGQRPVAVVDQSARPFLDLRIVVPVPDMARPPEPELVAAPPAGGPILGELMRAEPSNPRPAREGNGMWAALHAEILAAVLAHRATIIFVNSRSLCERLAQRLNELAGVDLVRAHHGSLAQRRRQEIEEALKDGQLRGIVATSSLELGIDMGAVELVVLVESPGSVARGLQRIGRAGHGVGQRSDGLMLPKFHGDLLECTVIADRMRRGELEPITVPQNALDVLAQHLVAMCVQEPQTVDALFACVQRAYPYHQLSRDAFTAVLDLHSGTYASDALADLRPLLSWDRSRDLLSARRGARLVAVLNGGTIPDRGLFGVYLGEGGPRVGELDEEMVHGSRRGDTFMLGASTWRIEAITRDRVLVSPAPGEPGKLPFWRGDGPGRPIELGRALGAFVRTVGAMTPTAARQHLRQELQLEGHAATNLVDYLSNQRQQTGTLPTDQAITVERFRDELGDWRLCILSPFGARVHAPWALALEAVLRRRLGYTLQSLANDDGIVLRFADAEVAPGFDQLTLDPDEVEGLVLEQLGQSPLFGSLFRENAGRALLLPRRRGQGRTPLWQQRLRAKMLLAAAQAFPSFPLVLETYRQCLRDVFDLPALVGLLRQIQSRAVRIDEVETSSPSPFARSLAFAYVAAYLYEGDAPMAERRAQALTLDHGLLQELLGQAELRELIDPAVLDAVEAELQGLAPGLQARDADELADLLRRLGDLTPLEAAARCVGDAVAWAADLASQGRSLTIRLVGEPRLILSEDVGRYRDALGVMPPGGLPARCLVSGPEPLLSLLRRYARSHGPFVTAAVVGRYGLATGAAVAALTALEGTGELMRGALRPGGHDREWCHVDVLRRLKRGTLAKLRAQVAAVDASAWARFLPAWHGLGSPSVGMPALEEALLQLEGLAAPWSAWVQQLLPARVADFRPDMLDMLCATGACVWVGAGALGGRDGRVRLLRRSQAALLLTASSEPVAEGTLAAAIMDLLAARGACFTAELAALPAVSDLAALQVALWDLVWAGHITNDTVQPLRSLGPRGRPGRGRPRPGRQGLPIGGRWSRVDALCAGPGLAVSPTQQVLAQATMLLGRYGIVSREAALFEGLAGGFTPIYTVLKSMEATGKVRRGYFVEGLAAAQFAYAATIERLRGAAAQALGQAPVPLLLAAVDPAQPYGALLPWPPRPHADTAARPRRVSGAWLALCAGEPLLYLEPSGHGLLTFAPLWREPAQLRAGIAALAELAARGHGLSLTLRSIDGHEALRHPQAATLREAGLELTYDGLIVSPTGLAGRSSPVPVAARPRRGQRA